MAGRMGRCSAASPRLGRGSSLLAGRRPIFRSWAGAAAPRLGRRPIPPRQPAWAGASFPRRGPAGRSRPVPPRLGRWLGNPAGPLPRPRLGRDERPWLGRLPLQAAVFYRAPAGPDQEDPAWPGFPLRTPLFKPGWAGM
jgi:hypothetical protein